jgi:hypothetical protein
MFLYGLRPSDDRRPHYPSCSIFDLHHLSGRLASEDLRRQPEPQLTRASSTERLLLKLLELLRDDLDQLLKLLKLCRDYLKQPLKLVRLLLLEDLQLLQLLRYHLQQLQNLLQRLSWIDSVPSERLTQGRLNVRLLRRRLEAESLTGKRGESPGRCWCGKARRVSESKRGSCDVSHLTSSIPGDCRC